MNASCQLDNKRKPSKNLVHSWDDGCLKLLAFALGEECNEDQASLVILAIKSCTR